MLEDRAIMTLAWLKDQYDFACERGDSWSETYYLGAVTYLEDVLMVPVEDRMKT